MSSPTPHEAERRVRQAARLARRQPFGRRTALIVAALLVVALLAPFLAWQIAG